MTVTLEQIRSEAAKINGVGVVITARDLKLTLRAVRFAAEHGSRSYGLCTAMKEAPGVPLQSLYNVSLGLFGTWPKFSGDYTYPVPDPEEPEDQSMAFVAYQRSFHSDHPNKNEGGWDRSHPYGKLRWELIEFMIETLEEVTKNEQ